MVSLKYNNVKEHAFISFNINPSQKLAYGSYQETSSSINFTTNVKKTHVTNYKNSYTR
jgi:hypothetical protein